MYKINQNKIKQGLHQEIKGTINRLEIRLNNPHQIIDFIEALSNYYTKRQKAINFLDKEEINKYDIKAKEIFEKYAVKILEVLR